MPNYLYWAAGLLIILILASIVAKRRSSKIDHQAPEHRAKENELYEAFGLEVPHQEEVPEDHGNKQKEVEAAFGGKKTSGEPKKRKAKSKKKK